MSNAAFGGLLAGLIAQNLLFIGVTLWWLRKTGRTPASIGMMPPTRQQIMLGIGAGLVVAFVGYGLGELELGLLQRMLTPDTFQRMQRLTNASGAEHAFLNLPQTWMRVCFALIGSLLAPVGEEMLFRGMILHSLQERWRLGATNAVLASSLLFAWLHLSPLTLLPLFVLGIAFAAMYGRTGSLWVPIGMHITNNVVSFALLTLTQ